jgi:hypothetical protein
MEILHLIGFGFFMEDEHHLERRVTLKDTPTNEYHALELCLSYIEASTISVMERD